MRENVVLSERAVVREPERAAFETIYCDSSLEELDARSLTLTDIASVRTSESKLREDIAKQYQTVFWERNLTSLIGASVRRRQNAFSRRFEAGVTRILETDDAVCRWNEQDGRCAECKESLYWNWAIGGRACLAQLDRVDVTKLSYADNNAWLCQACNMSKGVTLDVLAYDRHILDALDRVTSEGDRALGGLKEALALQKSRQTVVDNQTT
jgi:hypothetical protein